jgi:hypothetical protein
LVLVFLGAGASAPFGFPAMDGLENEISKRLKGKERDLLLALPYVGNKKDAEIVLQHLAAIENLSERGLDRLFARTSSYSSLNGMGFRELIELCHSLEETIKDTIFNVYQFRPQSASSFHLYANLFSIIAQTGKMREHYVYTTNYDRIIEVFCERVEGFQIRDGYEHDPKTTLNLWRPHSFDAPFKDDIVPVRLFKLHGSLNWKDGEYGPERVSPEIRLKPPTTVLKEDLLIYPGSKDPPEQEPFRTLYERFETQMKEADRCLVIGFSFRDPYLNRIFRDYVNSGKGQLLIMSRNCRQTVATNLLGLKDSADLERSVESGGIVPIPCHFGTDDWTIMLGNALMGIPAPIERPSRAGPRNLPRSAPSPTTP